MPPRTAQPSVESLATASIGREVPEVVVARGRLGQCAFLEDGDVDAVAVAVGAPVEGDDELQPRAGAVDASARYGIDLAELAERASFTGAAGTTHTVDLPRSHGGGVVLPWSELPHRIVFVGTGHGSADDLRRAGAALARATTGLGRVVATVVADAQGETARSFVEGYLLGAYRPPALSGRPAGPRPAEQLVLLGPTSETVVDAATRAAWATWLVRDLTTIPSNVKTPEWLVRRVSDLADAEGLELTVRGPEELAAGGFGGILAVGGGSAAGPRLVTVTYLPFEAEPTRGSKHVVVVGKGITYDTGGLSIKPREAMIPMKTDMAGAAVALAAVVGASRARSKHRVTAVLPLAENHFGADSYRPGDVLTLFGGTTVEVANTDAEGRLVLADALAFADAELDPDILIDVATLTGAASQGLGRGHGALYSSDEKLLAGIEGAAQATGERVWHMPLVDDYRDALRSTVADLRHVPIEPAGGGSITAALFLREFTGRRRWLHLDIAGPARSAAAWHEVTKGATGFGARLLLRFLEKLR